MNALWASRRTRNRPRRQLLLVALLASGCWLGLQSRAASFADDFSTNPLAKGWKVFGDTNLFAWNASSAVLEVTWDSSRTNSYFYFPLPTLLNRQDDFSFALDLKLNDIAGGVNPAKESTFELGIGFLNLDNATRTNFFRANSALSPNLIEFDYFPDTGFGATLWPSVWSTNSILNYNGPGDYTLIALPVGITMRIVMSYTASNQTLTTSVTTNGVSIGAISSVTLTPGFTNFRVGAFAIESYSDAGQNPAYGGSLLAHGTVDNIALTFPPPPILNLIGAFENGHWQAVFVSRTNWLYTLERSTNLQAWSPASARAPGNGATLTLIETNPPGSLGFYRVRAERP